LLPFATLAAHCLVKDWALRLELVNLDSFTLKVSSPAEQLSGRIKETATLKRAASDMEQRGRQLEHDHKKALDALGEAVKTKLLALTAKNFQINVYAESASALIFSIAVDVQHTLGIRTEVEWDAPNNPMVGCVVMKTRLGEAANFEGLQDTPLGEIDASSALQPTLVYALFDAVCQQIIRAQNLINQN
jgi:hypothetical protein